MRAGAVRGGWRGGIFTRDAVTPFYGARGGLFYASGDGGCGQPSRGIVIRILHPSSIRLETQPLYPATAIRSFLSAEIYERASETTEVSHSYNAVRLTLVRVFMTERGALSPVVALELPGLIELGCYGTAPDGAIRTAAGTFNSMHL